MTKFTLTYTDFNDEDLIVQVFVTHYAYHAGNPNSWDSPDDYHGYEDFEYEAYDYNTGYPLDINEDLHEHILQAWRNEIQRSHDEAKIAKGGY